MNASFKKFVKNIVSLAIVAGLGYYLFRNWDTFQAAFDASWYHILGLVFCVLTTWLLNCLQSLLLLRQIGVMVGFWENMMLQLGMVLGNHLPMRLGSLIRMRYFKRVHGLEYMQFVGIAGVRSVVILLYSAILGSIGLIGLKLSEYSLIWALFGAILFVLLITLGSYLIKLFQERQPKNAFLRNRLSEFLTAFEIIQRRPILFWQISGLVLMQFATFCMRLSISFDAIHVDLSPWVLLIMAPTTTLISFLSLTPGNLGLREWMIGVISLASGNDFSSGIFAGTVDRAVLLACTFIFGPAPLVFIWIRTTRQMPQYTVHS